MALENRPKRCPFCPFEAANPQEEVAHMQAEHPDVVRERLAAINERPPEADAVARLVALCADWRRYTQIPDQPWRDEMRQALVIEMRDEISKLAAECGL